eukprot:scaffold36846_cov15-Tisochrysis_lutea.AAC.1
MSSNVQCLPSDSIIRARLLANLTSKESHMAFFQALFQYYAIVHSVAVTANKGSIASNTGKLAKP